MGKTVCPFYIYNLPFTNYMKSTKKIYGVKGIMEWIAEIQCGKATVTVPFTGGSLSGYGIVPAQYATENPMMQAVIEKSDYYKSGKIFLIREMDGSGKYQLPERNAQQSNHMPGQAATASAVIDSPLNPDYKAVQNEATAADARGTKNDEPEADATGTVAEEDGMTVVEVTDIDAARDYLAETFNIARSNIRYKSNVLEKAAELKIKFVGLDE